LGGINGKKKLLVDRKKFEGIVKQMLETDPLKREDVKVSKKKPQKLIPPHPRIDFKPIIGLMKCSFKVGEEPLLAEHPRQAKIVAKSTLNRGLHECMIAAIFADYGK
jgi:hypothetical protein